MRPSSGLEKLPGWMTCVRMLARTCTMYSRRSLQAPRHAEVIDEGDAQRDQQRQRQQRLRRPPDGAAGRREHDELAVAVEPVERVDAGDQQRERGDDGHEVGQRQRRHLDQQPHVLTLRGHDVELAQGERHPDDARQRQQDDEQRGTGLPKDIPFEDRHADRLRMRGRRRDAGPPSRPIAFAFHVSVAEIRLLPSDLAL